MTNLDDDSEEDPKRGSWKGEFDFIFSLLGYSVGLGNVWRFPYLCYNNGGGAFLIPFVIMLFIAGLPLMFMELSFAQYAALGPAVIFKRFCPIAEGVGYGMIVLVTIVMLYYNVIIGWTIFYIVASFEDQLPWDGCGNAWNTPNCFSYAEMNACKSQNNVYFNGQCFKNMSHYNYTDRNVPWIRKTPAEEYF